MKRELALEFARVTEAAALAAHKWVGRGDKEAADQAAVDAMRTMLNRISIDGEIVIGEGEIDEAPMLYIGEKVGIANQQNHEIEAGETADECSPVDIAVDPVEGTRMTAQGQANAITVLAVADKGSFLKAPDMYMEKLIVGPEAKGVIDLNKPLMENINNVAKALKKELNELMIVILDKPRHAQIIKDLQKLGIKVYALPDGDVAGSLLTCLVDSDVDILYGIGGAPEGVISAAVIRALGGDMQARLKLRSEVKGVTLENDKISTFEKRRCEEMGLVVGEVLKMDDLVKDDEVIFSATGITSGDVLEGIKRKGNIARTQTLVVRGRTKTIRYINSIHNLDFKDSKISHLVK
ncbi:MULTISPECIES: class II fructose-bisphosphatase [Fusobacterium]|jgi:fructose-1,6-bisphosphatase II|uniref:Fructose-1,6-bisphosphatase n=1 Tax=Fusobacterium hominis TaxID=2764326 RepID=A0A7G9GZ75_9FUSO|nr:MULTISPECIES: class II fructose-bisphosphatase [Fusobacterium]QNM16107.1 class II fructose-bisphosphatase [Fusobacterium hominis]